jgi:hypothetical protein
MTRDGNQVRVLCPVPDPPSGARKRRSAFPLVRSVVGLGGLEPPASSLSGFCARACSQDCTHHLRELRTARDRYEPLGSDGMWTKRGPYTSRSRGQRRSARGGPCLARQTPTGCPRQASPPGNRLARGSPGGVWARDIPLYRRAVPGQRHGGTPAPCVFKPRARWCVSWTTWHHEADHSWCPEASSAPRAWSSRPQDPLDG